MGEPGSAQPLDLPQAMGTVELLEPRDGMMFVTRQLDRAETLEIPWAGA